MKWCMNIKTIAHVTDGTIYNLSGDEIVKNVVRSDNEVTEGAVFVALRGENNNGFDYAKSAIEKGAVCCVVNRDEEGISSLPCIAVDDTFKALRDIATYYRSQFNMPIVGVTGSVGKTSTKGMIASVLSQEYATLKTEGNYNNEVGVPLTVFRMSDDDEMAVIEMGMSDFGEISRLTDIVKPDIAVITNIGVSHIENLGSRVGIAKAKFEILEGLPQGDGTVILNGDDDMLWAKNGELDFETLFFGIENKSCDIVANNIKLFSCGSEFDVRIDGEDYHFETTVPGIHQVYNALAAILIGYKYNMKIKSMIKGVHDFKPEGLRQKRIEYKDYTVINDCYNACPASMKAGIEVLKMTADANGNRRCVACLADMLELGDEAKRQHEIVGTVCGEKKIDVLIAIGENAKYIAKSAVESGMRHENVYTFDDNKSAENALNSIIKKGDIILLKGSRGMKLEEIATALDNMADKN